MRISVDIGVFAHNEADGIGPMLEGLLKQDILAHPDIDARIIVLANGCTDATAAIAKSVVGVDVADLRLGGKSRTWNRFVHEISREEAAVLVFCDADIVIPGPDSLTRLVQGLTARPALHALNSQPVKDIAHDPAGLSVTDKLIASAGGMLDDWKTAICGQLYAMPAAAARGLHMPAGLPVEDGFLRAMILTDAMTADEDFSRVDGLDSVFHVYAYERGIGSLIRHQTRIVIGSAINAACFAYLRSLPTAARRHELARAAQDEGWLNTVVRTRLPHAAFGYVPWHFLIKRVQRVAQTPRELLQPKRLLITVVGFGFDAIVYLNAQIRMARGTGVGFW